MIDRKFIQEDYERNIRKRDPLCGANQHPFNTPHYFNSLNLLFDFFIITNDCFYDFVIISFWESSFLYMNNPDYYYYYCHFTKLEEVFKVSKSF